MANSKKINERKKQFLYLFILILVALLLIGTFIFKGVKGDSSTTISKIESQLPKEITATPDTSCTEGHSVETCWDGSEVRRVEPSCEFASCPDIPQQKEWHEYQSEKFGYRVKYPLKMNVLWEPEADSVVGVDEVHFMNSCAVIATIPSQTKHTKEFSSDIRAFIFSDEVQALEIGETRKTERQNKSAGDMPATYVYKRLADKVIDGVSWKAYQWGNTFEMHADEIHYFRTFDEVSYVLVVREGGSCPLVGPANLIESFSRLSK